MQKCYRVMDANLNRLREGLRVLEEISRLILADAAMTARIKAQRHRITAVAQALPGGTGALIKARDAAGDVGAGSWAPGEKERGDLTALVAANCKRIQEAARVLEEFGKLCAPESAKAFKEIRFEIYDLEQDLLGKLDLGS